MKRVMEAAPPLVNVPSSGCHTCLPVTWRPTSKTGFIYMLAGDTAQATLILPLTAKTADNRWVETGSHVMIIGAAAKTMEASGSYQKTADPDATKPHEMRAGT